MKTLILVLVVCLPFSLGYAADHIMIGNVSRTVEQLPNYAATDKGFFAQEGIEADVVLIGSTDTLVHALIAGHVQGRYRRSISGDQCRGARCGAQDHRRHRADRGLYSGRLS